MYIFVLSWVQTYCSYWKHSDHMLTYKFKKSEELIYLARLWKQFNSKVMLTSSFPFQIMSAVSCRQNLPNLIEKIPDGQARDLVLKFINGKERLVILSYQACYPTSTKRTSQSYLQTLTVAMTVKSLLVLILIFFCFQLVLSYFLETTEFQLEMAYSL